MAENDMAENVLEIKDLHVVYETDEEKVYAINGLDLVMKPGEMMGLVGETGAGKTTTALSIMKLLPDKIGLITGGSINVYGLDVMKASEHDMRAMRGNVVSMIFQDPMTSLNPLLTIGDQIEEVLLLHNKNETAEQRKQHVDELLKMIGLPPERKTEFPHQFSGGMKQRIVIAIALACEPKLLLADEPTTALDVTIQAQVLEMMKELQKKFNTAVLLITHDLGVVAQTCSSVAIMYAGEIVEIGTVADLFAGERHHPYTVGLFGSIPNMNVEAKRLNPIDGLMPDPTNLPVGCAFSDRCHHASDICFKCKPPAADFNGHKIWCHEFSNQTNAEAKE